MQFANNRRIQDEVTMKNKYRLFLELLSAIAILIIVATVLSMMLSGCGHNVVTHNRGIGIDISWDGSSYIPNLRLGQWDVTNAVVKENVDIEANTITKADTGSTVPSVDGSTSNTNNVAASASGGIQIKMKTGPQTNGYVKDMLTSETLSEHSVNLAKQLYSVRSEMDSLSAETTVNEDGVKVEQNIAPVATTTTETTIASKDESGVEETKTTVTTTEIPVQSETQLAVQEASSSVTTAIENDKWYYIVLGIAAVITALGGSIYGLYKIKTKNSSTSTDVKTVEQTKTDVSYDKPDTK